MRRRSWAISPLTLSLVDAEAALAAVDLGAGRPPPAPAHRADDGFPRADLGADPRRPCPAHARAWARPLDIATLERASDRKRRDALALVAALRQATTPAAARPRPPITGYYAALLASRCPAPC